MANMKLCRPSSAVCTVKQKYLYLQQLVIVGDAKFFYSCAIYLRL